MNLQEAAASNMLLIVRCSVCKTLVHYLAADLVEILAPTRPAYLAPTRCRACKTADFLRVDLRKVHPGDIEQLIVRRPSRPRLVRDWRDVTL